MRISCEDSIVLLTLYRKCYVLASITGKVGVNLAISDIVKTGLIVTGRIFIVIIMTYNIKNLSSGDCALFESIQPAKIL